MKPGAGRIEPFEVCEAEASFGLEPSAGFAAQHPVVVPVTGEDVRGAFGLTPPGPGRPKGQTQPEKRAQGVP